MTGVFSRIFLDILQRPKDSSWSEQVLRSHNPQDVPAAVSSAVPWLRLHCWGKEMEIRFSLELLKRFGRSKELGKAGGEWKHKALCSWEWSMVLSNAADVWEV